MAKNISRHVRKAVDAVLQYLKVDDPSGGIDLRRSATLISPSRARVCRNWTLDEPGALKVYPGWLAFLTSSLGNSRAQGARRIYLSAAVFTLFAYSGSIYKPTDGGVVGASVLSSLSATNEIDFPYDADLVAALDGANTPKKTTDGSTWTQFGITAPAAAPTAAAAAGGSLIVAHTYELSFSYRDDGLSVESNESATVQQATAGANLTVNLNVTASTDPQVDKIYVYVRDVTGGEGQRRRYTTTFANATATVAITANNWYPSGVEAPTDHNVPPALSFAVSWKNRWWGVIGRRLYFTQIFQNQSWPSLYYIDIPFEKGDTITALCPQGNTMVVFGAASKPFLIIGQTSLDFEVRPAFGAQAGAFGFRSVAAIENGILHAAAEGIYIFDGASDRLLSDDIDVGWRDCLQHAAVADLTRIAVVYDAPRKFIHVAVPRLYPFSAAGEWILDLHRTRLTGDAAWTSTDRNVGGYLAWDGPESTVGNRGRLFSWSDAIGKLFEECTGTTANGSDMVADYTGPTFSTGGVVARFTDFYGEYRPSAGSFVVEVLVDGKSCGQQTISITSGLTEYGSGIYGTSEYGGADRKSFPLMLPLMAEGLTVLTKVKYTGQVQFALYTYQIGVSPEPLPRGMGV